MTSGKLQSREDFLRDLLRTRDLLDFARIAVRQVQAFGCHRVQLAWNTEQGREQNARTYPHGVIHPVVAALLSGARQQGEVAEKSPGNAHLDCACLLSDNGRQWSALIYGRTEQTLASPEQQARWRDTIELLSARSEALLECERLQTEIERLGRAERLQRALYAISDCASSDRATRDVLRELHQIVGGLMYAKNFFIVRYQAEPESMQFVYFADSVDRNRRDPDAVIPAATLGNSLTLAMLRQGLPLHGAGDALREQLHLPRSAVVGPSSTDWLGVPMIEQGQVRGAVVVQSYEPSIRYTYEDQTLLAYLAQNIMTALARREAAQELERRVVERTRELREEIAERERSERLQAALFRIAEIAGGSGSMKGFYEIVYAIVGELLDARNFYIGLLSDDGEELSFPFARDDHDETFESRRRGRGLSEFVLRTGKPLWVDMAVFEKLRDAGEIDGGGIASSCWLGVPLIGDAGVFGLIAVQSYTPDYLYSDRDVDLLSFVSRHIAIAIERRRNAQSLRQANLQLEHASRTDPLTGLHNRRFLAGQVPHDLAWYERQRRRHSDDELRLVFAVVDIDHFKRVNDSHGHAAGDRVLQTFATALTALVQSGDYVVRWGGEEFLLVFRPLRKNDLPALGERIRRRISEQVFDVGDGLQWALTCSIGLAEYPAFPDSPREPGWEQIVEMADAALYWVKNNGRDGWAILRPRADARREGVMRALRIGSQALLDSPDLAILASR